MAKTKKTESETELKRIGSYFLEETELQLISSGCTVYDMILGGGYPLGRVSNNVGDKSSNKCIKNAYILPKDKSITSIDKVGKELPDGYSDYKKDLCIENNTYDFTSKFWKEKVEKTIKIKTKHGYSIEGTYDHPIVVWNNDCTMSFKKLKDIKLGDIAIIVKGINSFPLENAKIVNIYKKSKYAQNTKEVLFPERLNTELATLLGYFVADGDFKEHSLRLSNAKNFFREEVEEALVSLGVSLSNKDTDIHSIQLATLFKNLFHNPEKFTARYKFVPECILESTKEIQKVFIRSLLDCDGALNSNSIHYYTTSEKLAQQIHLMLLNFGIISTHTVKKGSYIKNIYYDHDYHIISMYAEDAQLYAKEIGTKKYDFSVLLKKELLKRNSDYNSIPFLINKMFEDRDIIREKVGWYKNGKMKYKEGRFPRILLSTTGNATYFLIKKFLGLFTDYSLYYEKNFYNSILQHNYHYDSITEIEYKEYDSGTYVYDVCIPKSHTFWANGFLNHNTGEAIETMANFRKQYPGGLIFYHENEAAFDIPYAMKIGMPNDDNTYLIEDKVLISDVNTSVHQAMDLVQEKGVPGLYILDTLDACKISHEVDLVEGYDAARRAALINSMITDFAEKLKLSNMHLMVISQIRENIGVMFGEKYRRAGGKALDFYSSQVVWLAVVSKIKKIIKKQEYIIGVWVKANCKKNKVGMPFRTCEFPVIFNYGIDDSWANLEWLKDIDGGLEELDINKKDIKEVATEIRETKNFELKSKIAEHTIRLWKEIEKSIAPVSSKY